MPFHGRSPSARAPLPSFAKALQELQERQKIEREKQIEAAKRRVYGGNTLRTYDPGSPPPTPRPVPLSRGDALTKLLPRSSNPDTIANFTRNVPMGYSAGSAANELIEDHLQPTSQGQIPRMPQTKPKAPSFLDKNNLRGPLLAASAAMLNNNARQGGMSGFLSALGQGLGAANQQKDFETSRRDAKDIAERQRANAERLTDIQQQIANKPQRISTDAGILEWRTGDKDPHFVTVDGKRAPGKAGKDTVQSMARAITLAEIKTFSESDFSGNLPSLEEKIEHGVVAGEFGWNMAKKFADIGKRLTTVTSEQDIAELHTDLKSYREELYKRLGPEAGEELYQSLTQSIDEMNDAQ